jgi:hypothetical protein
MAEYIVKKYAPRNPKTYRKTTEIVNLPDTNSAKEASLKRHPSTGIYGTPTLPEWEVRGITIATAMARAKVIKLTKIAEKALEGKA